MDRNSFLDYVCEGDSVRAARLVALVCNLRERGARRALSIALASPLLQDIQPGVSAENNGQLLDARSVARLILKLPDGTRGGGTLSPAGLIQKSCSEFVFATFCQDATSAKAALKRLQGEARKKADLCASLTNAGALVRQLLSSSRLRRALSSRQEPSAQGTGMAAQPRSEPALVGVWRARARGWPWLGPGGQGGAGGRWPLSRP